jgi:hypothetical protein
MRFHTALASVVNWKALSGQLQEFGKITISISNDGSQKLSLLNMGCFVDGCWKTLDYD